MSVSVKSLGCPKNVTDAEVFLGDLESHGYRVVPEDDPNTDVVLVNTCGFVEDAKRESLAAIMEAAESGRRVVVTGCMAQRYAEQLDIPEISAVVGFEHYSELPQRLATLGDGKVAVGGATVPFRDERRRVRLGRPHSAYVRLAEGCDHACTFCSIPSFRGEFRSKPWDSALAEMRTLAARGAKELVLVAEDTNQYGTDFGASDSRRLAHLLRAADGIVPWIRLLYCYPSYFDDALISAIAECRSVCKYIDMPLQHIAENVLRKMKRPGRAHTERLLAKLKQAIPGLALRTTFITGFPGETDQDHKELVEFVRAQRFRRAGFFKYSQEEGTPAADMSEMVDEEVKQRRWDELVSVQQEIEEQYARSMDGEIVDVLIDGVDFDGVCVGRTTADAPEIDGVVHVLQKHPAGTLIRARVLGENSLDLYAETVEVIEHADEPVIATV